MYSFLFF